MRKTVIWCDYVTFKYGEKAKLRYIDTHSFIVHIKTDDNCPGWK